MYCPNCGKPNPDNAQTCISCQAQMPLQQPANQGSWGHPGQMQQPTSNPYASPPNKPMHMQGPPRDVPNNMLLALICTLLCCMPFGLVGVVYASQVSGKVLAGQYEEAENSARQAKVWSILGIVIGGLVTVGYVVAMIALGINEAEFGP